MTLQAAAPGCGRAIGDQYWASGCGTQGQEWDVVRVNIPTQGVQPGKYLLDPAEP